ncbi:cell envelope integrity protein CreD [Parasphingorhabdus halotolerans]|uniref:Cell envelope integrity protein CreD n=1 Tax=Parasphingorhabdus halotolerans TaxID=2725558 RepID=A0A6H2DJM6_9SPHN|nr:cell envelope integrity protein CreD [Parasphingorhabdus halotolerans]QJB68590.1 cell envelope integrity protein CreD [Parasphingorhabdus halotolerans]
MTEIHEGDSESEPELSKPERSPGAKFLLVILMGFLITIPLLTVWALNYDRQSQSETAKQSITSAWGGKQVFAGPKIVLPYQAKISESVEENGKTVTRTNTVTRELFVAPDKIELASDLSPETKSRSIYEVILYNTNVTGSATFILPDDLDRYGVTKDQIDFSRAELRFGLSDARGLAGDNKVTVNGEAAKLQPGKGLGETGNSGFFAFVDGAVLADGEIKADFDVRFKGHQSLTVVPHAGQTNWSVKSKWPHPSFVGSFLPKSEVKPTGFQADYDIANLALGKSLISTEPGQIVNAVTEADRIYYPEGVQSGANSSVTVDLIDPVDLYSQVDRATKYGFLIIGFTFVAFLLFDLIGGIRISSVQYILVGVALVLFFVLLLAFAEIIGFALAYVAASIGTIGLITAYSASVLSSWRKASIIGGLLAALYGAIYILLSLEAYSLLIGSLLIFAALAGVMYVTRRLDWSSSLKRPKIG